MTLTDEQCEKLKPWTEVTPEAVYQGVAHAFAEAFGKPEIQQQFSDMIIEALTPALEKSDREWQQSMEMIIDPIIKKLNQQEQRIEKLEAALFRRARL